MSTLSLASTFSHFRSRFGAAFHPTRIIPGLSFLTRVWALSAPFWCAKDEAPTRRLLAGFVAIKLALIYVAVRQNAWFRDFYAAIQAHDGNAFTSQVLFPNPIPFKILEFQKM